MSGTPGSTHTRRRTLPSAIGEPMIWLTGGALVLSLAMIGLLAALVLFNGLTTFWPRPIERVTLEDGTELLGIRLRSDAATAATPERVMYQVGNRDTGQEPFRWISTERIASVETPEDAVMLERESWGVWFGVPRSIVEIGESGERTVVVEGADRVIDGFDEHHERARRRLARAERLRDEELGAVNAMLESTRLAVRDAEIRLERAGDAPGRLPWIVWSGVLVVLVGSVAGLIRARHIGVGTGVVGAGGVGIGVSGARTGRALRFALGVIAIGSLAALWIGAPWRTTGIGEDRYERIVDQAREREAELDQRYEEVLARIRKIEREDRRSRLIITEPTTGRIAPIARTDPEEPMTLSQVVRMVPANRLSAPDKVGVYLSRWWEFLSAAPREANTAGGVYPVIVGTVLMTLLLTIAVTPLGVIAALYLREYAKQGFLTSVIRIAVNNLAGVPSIVYGVFGLGFFCYTIGRYIDTGPAPATALGMQTWWAVFALAIAAAIGSFLCGLWGRPTPGRDASARHVLLRRLGWIGWAVTLVLAVVVVARTPYFFGFFGARAAEGSPTFGSRGLLWASLTLALLTLPVVIVATEEALAAVPDSMREGSYGCGASKWQTMRRVVLPGALPGILTGAILAMARGAGEVAPLMLVGAVKLTQDLPISSEPPFLHADRSFMHLGFHIYDLGFQSPDSQAARPMVWTTTLLFLSIVLALNLAAIMIRARIRGRMTGSVV